MPVYEYECTKCGHHTEILQNISDPPITKCELCKGDMKKLISQSSFRLKGTGWYVTDYASKSGGYDGKGGKAGDNTTKEAEGSVKKEAKGSSDNIKKDTSSTGGKKAKGKD